MCQKPMEVYGSEILKRQSCPWSVIFIVCLFRNLNTCLSDIREETPLMKNETSKNKMTSEILSNSNTQ